MPFGMQGAKAARFKGIFQAGRENAGISKAGDFILSRSETPAKQKISDELRGKFYRPVVRTSGGKSNGL